MKMIASVKEMGCLQGVLHYLIGDPIKNSCMMVDEVMPIADYFQSNQPIHLDDIAHLQLLG